MEPDELDARWTPADDQRLNQLNAADRANQDQLDANDLAPEHGLVYKQQIDAMLKPLLVKKKRAELQAQQQAARQVQETTAQAEAIGQQNAVYRARGLGDRIAQVIEPLTGMVAHLFEESPGVMSQLDWSKTAQAQQQAAQQPTQQGVAPAGLAPLAAAGDLAVGAGPGPLPPPTPAEERDLLFRRFGLPPAPEPHSIAPEPTAPAPDTARPTQVQDIPSEDAPQEPGAGNFNDPTMQQGPPSPYAGAGDFNDPQMQQGLGYKGPQLQPGQDPYFMGRTPEQVIAESEKLNPPERTRALLAWLQGLPNKPGAFAEAPGLRADVLSPDQAGALYQGTRQQLAAGQQPGMAQPGAVQQPGVAQPAAGAAAVQQAQGEPSAHELQVVQDRVNKLYPVPRAPAFLPPHAAVAWNHQWTQLMEKRAAATLQWTNDILTRKRQEAHVAESQRKETVAAAVKEKAVKDKEHHEDFYKDYRANLADLQKERANLLAENRKVADSKDGKGVQVPLEDFPHLVDDPGMRQAARDRTVADWGLHGRGVPAGVQQQLDAEKKAAKPTGSTATGAAPAAAVPAGVNADALQELHGAIAKATGAVPPVLPAAVRAAPSSVPPQTTEQLYQSLVAENRKRPVQYSDYSDNYYLQHMIGVLADTRPSTGLLGARPARPLTREEVGHYEDLRKRLKDKDLQKRFALKG